MFSRFLLTLLAWNYTLEAFFWILVGAILVVTVTVLSANPELARELIKGPMRMLSLVGRSGDGGLSKDSLPDQIEKEDVYEEIDAEETDAEETDTEEISDLPYMPVKGFWIRFAAFIIDLILAVIWLLGVGILSVYIGLQSEMDLPGVGPITNLDGVTIIIVVFLLFKLMMDSSKFQGTLGKYVTNIKIVDENGQRITRSKSFLRAGVYSLMLFGSRYIDGITNPSNDVGPVFILGLLGFIMIGFTKKKQGLHDMASRTFVASSHQWQWKRGSSNLLAKEKKVKPLYDPYNRIEKEEKRK